MNAPLTRRALLGATAAAGACALPAIAEAGIPVSDPADLDAALHAALDRWQEITAGRPALEDALDAAMDRARAAYPPRPAALYAPGTDSIRGLGVSSSGRERTPEGRWRCFYQPGDVEMLRASPPVTRWARVSDDHEGPPPQEIDLAGEARRREIVAAHDGWQAERDAVDLATGYAAADEAWKAEIHALNAAEDAAKLCPPRTLAGLARKAAWVADLLARDAGDDDLGEVFARQVAALCGVAP